MFCSGRFATAARPCVCAFVDDNCKLIAAWWLSRASPNPIAPLSRTPPTYGHCRGWQHPPQAGNDHATRTELCDGWQSAPRRESLASVEPRERPRRTCGCRQAWRAAPHRRAGIRFTHVACSNPTRPRPAWLPREPRTVPATRFGRPWRPFRLVLGAGRDQRAIHRVATHPTAADEGPGGPLCQSTSTSAACFTW